MCHVEGGVSFEKFLKLFAKEIAGEGSSISAFFRILVMRSQVVCEKGAGWVVEPTTNPRGERKNATTEAMHALFLDCDGRGNWDHLLAVLGDLEIAVVAYQSGGFTEALPKWRICLPLARPFDVRGLDRQILWKAAYTMSRVVFGSVGNLLGEGFDPMTETPCNAWFLTERRDSSHPPRRVLFRPGRAFDIESLVNLLPAPPHEPERDTMRRERPICDRVLNDAKFAKLVSDLAEATVNVPSGRHDLYLALPGALLDCGVSPDDVFAIVEEVSSRYPRPNAEKHRDNIHNAQTTIGRWERGEIYTRIGTVADRWPEIARVIDRAFPHPFVEAARIFLEDSAPAPSLTSVPNTMDTMGTIDEKILARARAEARLVCQRKKRDGEEMKILDRVLRRKALVEASEIACGIQVERAIFRLGIVLGWNLSLRTPLKIVEQLVWQSLNLTPGSKEHIEEWLDDLQRYYLHTLGDRRAKREMKRAQLSVAEIHGFIP